MQVSCELYNYILKAEYKFTIYNLYEFYESLISCAETRWMSAYCKNK